MNAPLIGHPLAVTSLWLDSSSALPDDALPEGPVDEIVVGAGITGLTTGLLLARAGRRVAVIEAREVGAVATGNTTAKVSLLQGTKYSQLLRYQSKDVAGAYVDANREGQGWLLRFCEDHGVPVQRRPAYTYAATEGELATVRKEYDAAEVAGSRRGWRDSLDTPFPNHGAAVLEDQAQFDPMDFLVRWRPSCASTAAPCTRDAASPASPSPARREVELEDGTTLRAEHVVLATGMPILDRGLYFSKVEPQRSYALAFDWRGCRPRACTSPPAPTPGRSGTHRPTAGRGCWSVAAGTRSAVRARSCEHVDTLREWTAEHFPGAVETHQWSAQDYSPHDGVPFVGLLPRGLGRIYVATGFDKWGMTNGVAAARTISGGSSVRSRPGPGR